MSNQNSPSDSDGVGQTIAITDGEGNVKEELEIVDVRDNQDHPGTFIIEVKSKD